jgi:uncharacterized protein with ParB-like and HNH nuclease domain
MFKQPTIQQYKSDIGFRTLVESVNDNMYIIPKYQRKYRWKKEQLIALVDSLINGLPIPPIYTCRNAENQLEILDGQQRVMSLFFYYIGYFLKTRKNSAVDFSELEVKDRSFEETLRNNMEMEELHILLEDNEGNKTNVDYNQLPIDVKRKLDYTTITVIEIKIDPDENREAVLRKTFANLNKGGTQLSPQEQRNGIYNCKFYDMLQKFNSNNSKWRSIWGRKSADEKDMEALLRFCALNQYAKYDFEKKEYMIEGYHSSYAALLDYFSEESMKFSEESIMQYERQLNEFVNLFSIHHTMSTHLTLIESFYAIYVVQKLRLPITQEICDRILKSEKYTENSRQGTTKMKKINERWKTVHEIWCRESSTNRKKDNQ